MDGDSDNIDPTEDKSITENVILIVTLKNGYIRDLNEMEIVNV